MNTGAEAVETALKLARKWAYKVRFPPPRVLAPILTLYDRSRESSRIRPSFSVSRTTFTGARES
mgnify:CR=1 FL=1